jgi:hypothetical protein
MVRLPSLPFTKGDSPVAFLVISEPPLRKGETYLDKVGWCDECDHKRFLRSEKDTRN